MIYHKLIHGNMLNNYDLGDITPEEALAQGYKVLIEAPREEGKKYDLSYEEDERYIREVLTEIIGEENEN